MRKLLTTLIASGIILVPAGAAFAEEPAAPAPIQADPADYGAASQVLPPAVIEPQVLSASLGPVPAQASDGILPVTGSSSTGLQMRNAAAAVLGGLGLVIVAGFRRRPTRAAVRSV